MIVKRSDKKAFYGIPQESGSVVFTRMRNFTELSGSKNPKEYSRQYVDENFERTDVTGYSSSWGFAFDDCTDDLVINDMIKILDEELLGSLAQREIVFVDFTKPNGNGFEAVKQSFAIIGDSEGGSTDAYTHNGNMKAIGSKIKGVATIKTPENANSDNVDTIEFAEGAGE